MQKSPQVQDWEPMTAPLDEESALELLMLLGHLTERELEMLEACLSLDQAPAPYLENKLQLVEFLQMMPPTPALH